MNSIVASKVVGLSGRLVPSWEEVEYRLVLLASQNPVYWVLRSKSGSYRMTVCVSTESHAVFVGLVGVDGRMTGRWGKRTTSKDPEEFVNELLREGMEVVRYPN